MHSSERKSFDLEGFPDRPKIFYQENKAKKSYWSLGEAPNFKQALRANEKVSFSIFSIMLIFLIQYSIACKIT